MKIGIVSDVKLRDWNTVQKAAYSRVRRLWYHAVQEFVVNTASEIKVDTGMSMASLYPLAAKVRLGNIIWAMSQGVGPKVGHKTAPPMFEDNIAKYKSRSLGKRLGQRAFHLSFGSPAVPNLEFSFEIVVYQYLLHELGIPARTSGPWDSIKKGKEAMLTFLEQNAAEYLLPKDFMYFIIGQNLSAEWFFDPELSILPEDLP